MSGNWAWQQAVCYIDWIVYLPLEQMQDVIAVDPETHRSMFVPLILSSDKTTVSVVTGHNKYYPLYLSIGNVSKSCSVCSLECSQSTRIPRNPKR
jgi:hypothetical protein